MQKMEEKLTEEQITELIEQAGLSPTFSNMDLTEDMVVLRCQGYAEPEVVEYLMHRPYPSKHTTHF